MADDEGILTVTEVRNAPLREKRYSIADRDVPGMRLVVYPSGKKTYVIIPRVNGKKVTFTIGNADPSLLTLADARKRGRAILRKIGDGEDPRAAKQAVVASAANTVEAVANQWFVHLRINTRTSKDVELALKNHVFPRLGKRPIKSVGKGDIMALTDAIVARGSPAMAHNIYATVRRLFTWACDRDLLETSVFEHLNEPPKPAERTRVLNDAELTLVWSAAEALGYPAGRIVQLLILTAARRSEVADMRWDEIDPTGLVWTIPAARSKNKRAHTLPLTPLAQSILASLPRIANSPYVFTSSGELPFDSFNIANRSINRMITDINGKAIPPWVIHDLRRSTASGLGRLGVFPHVIGRVLNHTPPKITRIYQLQDYALEMRIGLEVWAKHIESLTAGSAKTVEEMRTSKKIKRLLTTDMIAKLDIANHRRLFRDDGAPDLFVSITASGHKSWVIVRTAGERKTMTTLGPVASLETPLGRSPRKGKSLSPEAARAMAHKMASARAST